MPREIAPGLLFIGTPFMVLVRGLLFFALKGIYDYLKPLMLVLGAFCMAGVSFFFLPHRRGGGGASRLPATPRS